MLSVRLFFKDEEGVTSIEYGLIAGLIALAILVAITALGGSLNTMFSNLGDTAGAIAA